MSEKITAPQFQPLSGNNLVEKESFLPMLHGKATDSMAEMTARVLEENKLNNTGVIDTGNAKLIIDKFAELTGTLGVSTHKLLSTAVAEFTHLNHIGNKNREVNYTAVNIPLKEYAMRCGYDVEKHITSTIEEEQKETKRVKGVLDNARKKIRKDLSLLFSSSLSWREKFRGKQENFMDIRLVEAKGIRKGYILIKFTQTFAQYLIKLPLTQYPIALLKIDERNSNAYIMGLKMSQHFNLDNNQLRGTAQLLKVKTLLASTTLPTVEEVRKQRASWETRIKEPFENSLDALTACGLLENWEYSKAKGESMTDDEATKFSSYERWSETLVKFTLQDAPNHHSRLESKTRKNSK